MRGVNPSFVLRNCVAQAAIAAAEAGRFGPVKDLQVGIAGWGLGAGCVFAVWC